MSRLSSTAVMNRRALGPEALDYFPTPPWATRVMLAEVLVPWLGEISDDTCLEPCCGEGHMVGPLRERFRHVAASDKHDYGRGFAVRDVLDMGAELPPADWLITNPPFPAAADIACRVLETTQIPAMALLVRLNWLEGAGRYRDIFSRQPPLIIAVSVDRIPMIEGAYDPDADTATAYAWMIWDRRRAGLPATVWIAPGAPQRWFRQEDLALAKPGEAARRKAARKAAEAEAAGGEAPVATQDLFGGQHD